MASDIGVAPLGPRGRAVERRAGSEPRRRPAAAAWAAGTRDIKKGAGHRPLRWLLVTPRRGLVARPPSCRRIADSKAEGRTSEGLDTTEHAVLIVGGGPTGLMLAAELALAGVDAAIVERRASQILRPARRWTARTNHRGPRSAWHRRSVPRGGTGGPGRGLRSGLVRHQRLPDAASLRAGAVAEPHRAHPGRLGRRAARDHLPRA